MGFLLLFIFPHVSSSHYAWNGHRNCPSIKSLYCIRPCLVTRQMFWSTCFKAHCKSLPICNFNCETFFCQIFWQFGTEFLCLANFIQVCSNMINSMFWCYLLGLSVNTSPFSRVSMHWKRFFFHKLLAITPLGLKFHLTFALICVKIALLPAEQIWHLTIYTVTNCLSCP